MARSIIVALALLAGSHCPTQWATVPVRHGNYMCWTEHKVNLPNETLCVYAPQR